MSTPAATARYIIAADDKTKSAIASVNNGFKNMERGIKGTVSRINAAFGLLAGMALKRAFQDVFAETARGSREFASALDSVKSSARSLLSAKDGVPGATAALNELSETLQDPAVVAAADAITSSLITGFADVTSFIAKATAGLVIFFGKTDDEIENLGRQAEELTRQIQWLDQRGLSSKDLRSHRRSTNGIDRGSICI